MKHSTLVRAITISALIAGNVATATAQISEAKMQSWGKVLIVGGAPDDTTTLSSSELYDPTTNSFAPADQTASMNTARYSPTATLLTTGPNAGKLLIAGGRNTDDIQFASTSTTELVPLKSCG